MTLATHTTSLFSRNLRKPYPVAVRGQGCWIVDASGRRYLDASGQAAVVSIGHGIAEIGRAMAEQSSKIAFAHTTQFVSEPAEKLAARVLAIAPANFRNGGRVYFTSGGSEATETAIKLARQYFLETKQPLRYRVVSRKQSYHGSTLGAMSVSGNVGRRAPYAPMIPEWGHVAPCFCYHCPFDKTYPGCNVACADDLDKFLRANDASSHWGFEPDIILTGKGIASGYAPLGAVLVAPHIVDAFERGTATFMHGFTYQAHPVATAAGNAVFDYLEAHQLFEGVAPAGESLYKAIAKLASHPHVGQVRGLGLLQGVEFVKDKNTREPFPKDAGIAEKIRLAALENGVLLYPGQGTVDGSRGDHILLAPPFVIKPEEGELIADALCYAVGKVFAA